MARLGTALESRREDAPAERTLRVVGERVADALERRRAAGPAAERRRVRGAAAARAVGPLSDRLIDALERQVTRAVERRLAGGDGSADRTPGLLEQRLVAAIERRLPAVRRRPDRSGAGLARIGRNLQRGGRARLPAERRTTLRALVVSIVARSLVRALALFVRILGRGLLSAPVRRLVRHLARRATRAGPSSKAGFLALLLGSLALLARALSRRLAGMSASSRSGIMLMLRLLPAVRRLAVWFLRALAGLLGRELRRAAAARRTP